MNPNPVKQYTAKLELPNHHLTIELVGDDFGSLKEHTQRILNGGARFEPSVPAPGGTVMIYHTSFDSGNRPLGWISVAEVPEHLSNKAMIESRRLQAA
jgi:hypothetical protein